MSCDKNSDEFIKDLIYRNKVVVFGFSEDDHSQKVTKLFKDKFEYDSKNINLDKQDSFINDNLKECLKIRTNSNKIPMVYLNGIFVGGWRNIENMEYRRDLEIFF